MLEQSKKRNNLSGNDPLDKLRKLILINAVDTKQSVLISNGTHTFFYHAYVANSLLENGFVLSPPAFAAPAPIEIRWGQWQGITHVARWSVLKEYNEINAWSMNWLSQKTGQQFLELVNKISSKSALDMNQRMNLTTSALIKAENFPSENLVRISYNYRLEGKEFESVPIYPAHLLKIIHRLGSYIEIKTIDDMYLELVVI